MVKGGDARQTLDVRTTLSHAYLRTEPNASPSGFGTHELFSVPYRRICKDYQPVLPLNVYAGRRADGRLVLAEIAIPRAGLREADLKELSHLNFYLSPDGYPSPQHKKIFQPVSMWLFGNNQALIACLRGTRTMSLKDWMELARQEEPDLHLHAAVIRARKGDYSILLRQKKKKATWPNLEPMNPKRSLSLFRYEESLKAPPRPSPTGILTSVGKVGSSSSKSRRNSAEMSKTEKSHVSLPESSDLRHCGYRIHGISRSRRWQILMHEAIPKLGLKKVAATIAGHRRRALSQTDGAYRYAHAVGEWEHDLERLKREIYPKHRSEFSWPL